MQSIPSLAKLDRFLLSTDWDQAFPLTKVVAAPRITSDHSPILLSTGELVNVRRFRFEDVWLTRDDFCSLLPLWWGEVPSKGSSTLTLVTKLRHCHTRIKEWSKTCFHSIARTLKTVSDEIQLLDAQEESLNLSPDQLDRRRQLKSEYAKVVAEEEILWKSRANQHWLREGDNNTRFFHAMANGRRRENAINVIEDDGRQLFREGDKRNYFNKFKDTFTPATPSNPQFGDWSELFGRRPFHDPSKLTLSFTVEEVKKAIFQLGPDKAPGPDGFNLRFY